MRKCTILALAILTAAITACKNTSNETTQPQSEQTTVTAPKPQDFGQFDDIKLPDTNRNLVSLGDIIKDNKLTIIDFWASWCGPCIEEMPNMVSINNDFKDKGLGIIGVSLDKDPQPWTNAISNLGLNWNHVSELKGWGDYLISKYNIEGIPYTLLVNTDGTIIAKELRGEMLRAYVTEYLENTDTISNEEKK